jgi:uncharacterized protein with NAD-binding domain and iron-sulfur cluster
MTTPFLDCTQPVTSFEEVIARLDRIVETAHHQRSRIGYFAALYHHVAVKFKACVEQQLYQQPELIERLDLIFFNRYLDALRHYCLGATPTEPWLVAFEAAQGAEPIVLQHLLLGMTAHIAFDLGIAVSQTCPADRLPQLEGDFITMNNVLASLVGDIHRDLTRIWPMLGLFNRIAGADEDGLMGLSIREGRSIAWNFATGLSTLSETEQRARIAAYAAQVASRERLLWNPLFPLNLGVRFVRLGEHETVRQTIETLINRRKVRESATFRMPSRDGRRKKVAILGGGVGAMTAAFALTDPDNPLADHYDVTVYQLGWRLGGKGASGRNPKHNYRIEEHGLHIWFGSYDNAFRVIQKCYDELRRAPDAPLASWQEAFKAHSVFVLQEKINGQWLNWISSQPTNDLLPGGESLVLPPWEYIVLAIKLMGELFEGSDFARPSPTGNDRIQLPGEIQQFFDRIGGELASDALSLGLKLLRLAHHVADRADEGTDAIAQTLRRDPSGLLQWLAETFDQLIVDPLAAAIHDINHALTLTIVNWFMAWFWDRVKDTIWTDSGNRHLWILLNFTYANIRGGLHEDVIRRGFDVLNEYEDRDWLKKYAFEDNGVMLNSAYMLSVYDALFAYEDGDNRTPSGASFPPKAKLEAGTAMRCGIRQFLLCKGAGVWKMQAGMGDTIFAPMYEVLKRRGVKFKFFHRVRRLCPSSDNRTIERIILSRQVKITPDQEAKGGYEPLIPVKGLPCWPNTPLYDQIVDGECLKQERIDLESYTTADHDVEELPPLTVGKDFDIVVLGISLGALPYICPDLITASRKWKDMVDHVKTVRTQGFQIWFKPTAYELGWTEMDRPVGGGYDIDPIDAWADMSHLIAHEGWTVEHYPQQLSYFCGAMRDDVPLPNTPYGPMPDRKALDQHAATDKAKVTALGLLNTYALPMLPNTTATDRSGKQHFRWELLVDPRKDAPDGEARFDSQYWRGNVQPSERYVLSVPGSTKYRLPANDPHEFTNLYLAGDWTNNGLNIGCVEAATMSGLLASHAISRYPRREQISGLDL